MLALSAGALCDAVEAVTGITTAAHGLKFVNDGYAKFLEGLDPRDNERHIWSFLQPLATLALAYQTTGTATGVYSAATEITTVTATAATFQPTNIGDSMVVADTGTLTIADYTSATVVTVSGSHAFTGKAITIPHGGLYDLPSDFGGMIDRPYYAYSTTATRCELHESSAEQLLRMYENDTPVATAYYWAAVPAAFVAATGQRWQMMFYPRFDEARFTRYRYLVIPAALTDSSSVYTLGGAVHCYTIKTLALSEYELSTGQPGIYTADAKTHMITSIDHDRKMTETVGAVSIGHGGPEPMG